MRHDRVRLGVGTFDPALGAKSQGGFGVLAGVDSGNWMVAGGQALQSIWQQRGGVGLVGGSLAL